MGLCGAHGARSRQRGLINGDLVVAGGQVLELVLAVRVGRGRQRLLHARRGRVGQRDGDAGQRLVRTRRRGATVVIDIPEDGVTDLAV